MTSKDRDEYISGNPEKEKLLFPKNYAELFPDIDLDKDYHFPAIFNPEKVPKKENLFGTAEISKKLFSDLELDDDSIVEFRWSTKRSIWVPIRARNERTELYKSETNKTYFGNAWFNALAIHRTIVFPITTKMMIGEEPIPENYWQVGDKELIRPMLRFHSYIKIQLYNEYAKGIPNLLELGGGQANDFKKWVKSKVESVVSIDLDPQAIQEGMERTRDVKGTDIKFIVADINQNLKPLLIKNNAATTFNSIISNFAVHYFTMNKTDIQQLIDNIKTLLKKNGYFVFTTFNGERVFAELAKTNPLILENENKQRLFQINAKYPPGDNKLKHYGQNIEVYVESIGKPHPEGLVNLKYIIDKFCENGFDLIENTSFADIMDNYHGRGDMSVAERKFSGLYNLVALQKK